MNHDIDSADLKAKTIRGGLSRVAAQGANFALRLGSLMILARLIEPKDFGLIGMVSAVTGVFGLFKDAGLSMITVQRANITDQEVSALFWLNICVAAILAALSAAAAPVLVAFYSEPRLFWVAIVMGFGFLFNGAGVQHAALLQRHMRFTALAMVELVSLTVSIVIAIGMALAGYRHWALVGMAVSLPLVSCVGAWIATGWVPGLPTRQVGFGSMVRFGGTVSLNGLIVYCAYNVDKLLLGRFAGAETLGVYGRAYQLVSIPTENLHSAVGSIAVSALSRLQGDPIRFRSYFLNGYSLFLSITVPITLFCALFATDIVQVLLGGKWSQAAPIFRLLAPTILAFALINPMSWLLFATGRIDRSLRMAFVIAPLVIAAYAVGLKFGASGVAIGFSSMMTVLTIPLTMWAAHGSVVSPRDLWQAARPPLAAALVAAAVALPLSMWLDGHLTALLRLVIDGSVLSISYVCVLYYVAGQRHRLERLAHEIARAWSPAIPPA